MGNQCCFKQEDALLKEKVSIHKSTLKTSVNFDIFGLKKTDQNLITLVTKSKKEFKFNVLTLLGSGSFGKVYLTRCLESKRIYAMKVIEKKMIKEYDFIIQTMRERQLLEKISSPFIVKLEYAFQSSQHLFFLTEFGQGGELYYHLILEKTFNEDKIRHYIAEIILALEALHNKKCFYRDLKPENILIDSQGHIKLTDFGLSKINNTNSGIEEKKEKSNSIVGTQGYFAPEILLNGNYDHRVDFWSLGVIMFQMLEGVHPFENLRKINPSKKQKEKFKEILNLKPVFNSGCSIEAKSLCSKLLEHNPNDRYYSVKEIKKHSFFKKIRIIDNIYEDLDWIKMYNKNYTPQFIPRLNGDDDTRYFHRFYTDQSPDSLVYKEKLSTDTEDPYDNLNAKEVKGVEFKDFTYVCKSEFD